MKDALFAGVNAAVLTPMRDDLSVDLDRMAAHCHWLLANGCTGLAVLGTTGEANSIGINERLAVLEGLAERGVPTQTLMPGTGVSALTDTVLLTRQAASLGCRGALVLPPFYYKNPSDDGLFAFFSEVIQRVGGGIKFYFYNFPQQSAVPLSVDLIGRLLHAYPEAVKGVKDSSGSFESGRAYIEAFAPHGFEVYAGDDTLLRPLLQLGAAGCITAAANVNAAVAHQVYANFDSPSIEDANTALCASRAAVTGALLIPSLKALMARHAGDAAWLNIRPPHLKLTDEQAAKLFALFDACGVTLTSVA